MENVTVGGPISGDSTNNGKLALLIVWSVVWGGILFVGVLYNLYVFGGVDFPDGSSIAGPYAAGGWLSVYGGSVLAWFLGAWFVKRDTAWIGLIAMLATPIVLQIVWILLYIVLGERHGYLG